MNKSNEIRAIVIKKLREFGYDPSTIIFYDGYIIEFLGDKMKEDEIDLMSAFCGSSLQFIRSYKTKNNGYYDVDEKYYNYIFISRGNGYKSRKRTDDMSAWAFLDTLSYLNQ